MVRTDKPVRGLTAADLMSREVLTLPQHISPRAAARLLARTQVSGAPVIDADGRCIGVLSATDFVRCCERGCPAAVAAAGGEHGVCDWEVDDADAAPVRLVKDCMTADLVTAAPGTSITKLARMMLDAHVHRVIVVDEERRPVGVVSSTDVLAVVASAPAAPV